MILWLSYLHSGIFLPVRWHLYIKSEKVASKDYVQQQLPGAPFTNIDELQSQHG